MLNKSAATSVSAAAATPRSPDQQPAGTAPIGKSPVHMLGFFGFFAITASMVVTVYEYPTFASSGLHLVFFLVVGGILWFLPVGLCAAEMATVKGWESGGIFAWVGNTLGKRWGFAALFYQWFQITVGFVTMAFFILAAFAYVVNWDALYNNPLVMFFGVGIIVWALTFVQLGGTKYTARISKVGLVGGVLVPILILMGGLIAYFATGGVSQLNLSLSPSSVVPDFTKVDTLVIFASFILAYMGIEASASHVNELRNPTRNYPLVMIVLCIMAILFDAIGGMAVATTLSQSTLDGNMSFGVIEAFEAIFASHFNMGWLVFVIALLLSLGVLAEISAWIVGPSRALLDAAREGIIPRTFAKTNRNGVSVKTVIIQAVIVTFWDAVLCGSMALSGGSSSSVAYLTAIGLTVVIYLVAYVLFFLAYFYLVLKHKDLPRAFQLPGGTPFKLIVGGAGMFMTLATLVVSFFPSSSLSAQANAVYVVTLLISFVVSVAVPFVIYAMKHRWEESDLQPRIRRAHN